MQKLDRQKLKKPTYLFSVQVVSELINCISIYILRSSHIFVAFILAVLRADENLDILY